MDSRDRMLLGELKAHHSEMTKRMDRFETHLDAIEIKIDTLQKFRWQIMGVVLFVSTIVAYFK